jgi:hypothetical protein
MRWLTRQWHGQGPDAEHLAVLTDAEGEALAAAYRAHNEALRPQLPVTLRRFMGEPDELGYADLHDAVLDWWALDEPRSLTLALVCRAYAAQLGADGFLEEIGYRRLVIQYRGRVELVGTGEADLHRWLDDMDTEFLYDEVDLVDDGRFEHRHLLWPRGEFGVRFEDVGVIATAPVPARAFTQYWRQRGFESSSAFPRLLRAHEVSRDGVHRLRRKLDNFAFATEKLRDRGRRGADDSKDPELPG